MKAALTKTAICFGLLAGFLWAGCAAGQKEKDVEKEEDRDEITLMHVDAGKEEFEAFIQRAEETLNLTIHVVPCPINADSRHAKISTILASGDSGVDIITVNDEMISEFKAAGYLEPLQKDIMTLEVRNHYPREYVDKMLMYRGNIYSVPYMMDVMMLWVNQEFLDTAGLSGISTREELEQFLNFEWEDGQYAYGGAWEKTYVYNEIGAFISLFGGDYYNWENPRTREAAVFLYQMAEKGQTSREQLLDQYEQLNQKFMDGKYGLIFAYSGSMNTFVNAGVYGEKQLHPVSLPDISGKQTAYVAAWQYVLNRSSLKKEAAKRFLEYAAGREGSIDYAVSMNRLPCREDLIKTENLDITGYDDMKEYLEGVSLQARPLPQNSMEYISQVGILFQKYITGELALDRYSRKMQELAENMRK